MKHQWWRPPIDSDWLTTYATIFAVVISVFSLVVSLRTSQVQQDIDSRNRLTDTLDRYLENLRELTDNLRELSKPNLDIFSLQALSVTNGYLLQQGQMLINQAASIADRISDQVNSNDYITLAIGMYNVSDYAQAEFYYRRALEKTDNELVSIVTRRAFAAFLFTQVGRENEGRDNFQQVIQKLQVSQMDYDARQNWIMQTYISWAISEQTSGDLVFAHEKITLACDAAKQTRKEINRRNNILKVNADWLQATRVRQQLETGVMSSPQASSLPPDESLLPSFTFGAEATPEVTPQVSLTEFSCT